MAVLPEADRVDVWGEHMARNTEEYSLGKADLRAVVDAADVWAQDNKASYNAALPLPGRTALSTQQKADVLVRILRKRFGAGI